MGANKLLADVDGKPMIRRTVEAILPAVDEAVVVTGRDAEAVQAALSGLALRFVHNADFAAGLSTSLKRGIAALDAGVDAAAVVLGDMPLVTTETLRRLIAAYNPAEHRSICVPVHKGEKGNPVLWGKQHFPLLLGLSGDRGARGLIDQLTDDVVEVVMPDDAVLTDIDTPEALAAMTASRLPGS